MESRGRESGVAMGWVSALARIVFGGIFILASLDKIANPRAFAEIIYNYHLLPDILINITAIWLPWLEATAGLLLVWGRLKLGASVLLCGLMAAFMAALGVNLARGLNVACGCFSTAGGKGSPILDLARDAAILLLGVAVVHREAQAVTHRNVPRQASDGLG